MPEEQTEPPPLPPQPRRTTCWQSRRRGDPRFTSKRLANQAHAEKLLADIRSKGRIE